MKDAGSRVDQAQWGALQKQADQLRRRRTGPRIFLSYRHDETEWQASWIAEVLIDRYGEGVV